MTPSGPLLSVNLSIAYANRPGLLRNLIFHVNRGEILGLVGESGAGKSTIALSVLRLLSFRGGAATGEILFENRDLIAAPESQMRRIRGREVGFVPQSALSSLNPALRIGTQLVEAWAAHASRAQARRKDLMFNLLEQVNLPASGEFLSCYPRQLSVGQAQRVLIAMAIMHRPSLLVADEPTSALDMITQAEILKLFARLNAGLDMAILYISHDLASVASLCHRIAILHAGQIVETGAVEDIFSNPRHPYTRCLIEAMPKFEGHRRSTDRQSRVLHLAVSQ